MCRCVVLRWGIQESGCGVFRWGIQECGCGVFRWGTDAYSRTSICGSAYANQYTILFVRAYVCVCTHAHANQYTILFLRAYMCVCACMHMRINIQYCLCMHICVCVHAYANQYTILFVCAYMCVCMYAHANQYTILFVRAYMCVCVHACTCESIYSIVTILVDVEVEHGVVCVVGDVRQVEREVVAGAQELLHLAAVIQLEQRAHAPHQREHVQVLVVAQADLVALLVLLHRDQARQQLRALRQQRGNP